MSIVSIITLLLQLFERLTTHPTWLRLEGDGGRGIGSVVGQVD